MSGRAYQPRFLWMWPNARISVMGGKQASGVIKSIKEEQAAKAGSRLTKDEIDKLTKPILKKYDEEGNPYYSSARLWDDGIISPTKTREILIYTLTAISQNPIKETKFPIFRM